MSSLTGWCVGSKLGVLLVDSTAGASEVLQWCSSQGSCGVERHMPLRLWPLQDLQIYDHTAAQRKAQAAFRQGIPRNVLLHHECHERRGFDFVA